MKFSDLQKLSPTIRHIASRRIQHWEQVTPFAGSFVITETPQQHNAFNPDGLSPFGISLIGQEPQKQFRLLQKLTGYRAYRLLTPTERNISTLLTLGAELPAEGLQIRLASLAEMQVALELLKASDRESDTRFEGLSTKDVLAQLTAIIEDPTITRRPVCELGPRAASMGR